MLKEVKNGSRTGMVRAISSKSHVHRLLICSALAKSETIIEDVTFSKDIYATVDCINGYLADVVIKDNSIKVSPYSCAVENTVLKLNESGSTYRFLVPVACAKGKNVSFTGAQRLAQRPLSPLYGLLTAHGAVLSEEGVFPLDCSGTLKSGLYEIPGDVSSQFISGLIFALPLLDGDSVIRVTGKMESYPYIKMTLDAVRAFGIVVEENGREFFIKGNQSYISPQRINAEGDWSNAAFFICAGALSQKGITISNLNPDSLQGDKEVVNIVRRMGANAQFKGSALTVCSGKLRGIDIDAAQIPDLVPVLATIACVAEGKTVIYNAGRLKIKESDRIESVYCMLNGLGADIEKTDDGFVINGKTMLSGGTVNSFNDHRIVMSASVASMRAENSIFIENSEAVQKSYPLFFEDFNKLETE